jgi:small conductance mechanosensitive channel
MLLAALSILEAWKVDAFQWIKAPAGQRLFSVFFSIALVVAIAVAVWEVVNAATERYLAEAERSGKTPAQSARARTLLPLMRKALLLVLGVIVSLMALSELGIHIGPLLAGAGIIGLAVGFGAQKLVQDIITGVFILLEDAVAVGDVVKVAGIGGQVEELSIRSIRLRDLSGNVHTIPFSSVDTVTNMTRLYSYYVIDIAVAYREDTDQVAAVCRLVLDEMRSDPEFGPDILEPLEVLGVDQFADSAVIIKARIKTRPIRQWAVGREFNRRMKKRFDELEIEIPFPHRTLYFGAGKDGSAPPLRTVVAPKQTEHGA